MSSIWATARCFSESVARNASAASTTSAAFGEASKSGAADAGGAVCRGEGLDGAEVGREEAERQRAGRGDEDGRSIHPNGSCSALR